MLKGKNEQTYVTSSFTHIWWVKPYSILLQLSFLLQIKALVQQTFISVILIYAIQSASLFKTHLCIYLGGLGGDGSLSIYLTFGSSGVHTVPTSRAQHVHQRCSTRAKSRKKNPELKEKKKKKVVWGFFPLPVSESFSVGLWLWLRLWHRSRGCYSPCSTWESFQEIVLSWILLLSSNLLHAQSPLCSRRRNPCRAQAVWGTKGCNFCATSLSASLIVPLDHLK